MKSSILLAASLCGLAHSISWNVKLDAFGPDAVRVRVGAKIIDPKLQALLPDGPESASGQFAAQAPSSYVSDISVDGAPAIEAGNLRVETALNSDGAPLVTATRISDGKVLLKQTGLVAGAPDGYSNPSEGAFSALVSFEGHGDDERLYGLGEQRIEAVQRLPFFSRFEDSQDYGISHGG